MGTPHFVTLTFHRRPEDPFSLFHRLRQWLIRRRLRAVWRIELQKRGVEHFHLIVWGDTEQVEKILEYWHSIASEGSFRHRDYGARVDKVEGGIKALMGYLSKYVSKAEDAGPDEVALWGHRRWGKIGRLILDPFDERRLSESEYHTLKRLVRRLKRARNRKNRGKRSKFAGLWGDTVYLAYDQGLKLLWWVLYGDGRRHSKGVLGSLSRSGAPRGTGPPEDPARLRNGLAGLAGV